MHAKSESFEATKMVFPAVVVSRLVVRWAMLNLSEAYLQVIGSPPPVRPVRQVGVAVIPTYLSRLPHRIAAPWTRQRSSGPEIFRSKKMVAVYNGWAVSIREPGDIFGSRKLNFWSTPIVNS